MVVNRSRRCSYRRLLPIWMIIFSIASCRATEAPYQNRNDEKLVFESKIDGRAELLEKTVSSIQTYDQLVVEPSNLQTKLSVSEATEVTQTPSSSDDSVAGTISQFSSDAVEEYEELRNDNSYKRVEVEESIIGTTEQSRHIEIKEKQTVALDDVTVKITAAADDSSMTSSTATSTSTVGQTMDSNSNSNTDDDTHTRIQNTNSSPNLSHSNNQEELPHNMAQSTTVDPPHTDTSSFESTHNDDDDDDDDESSSSSSGRGVLADSHSSDMNNIDSTETTSEHKTEPQTESESVIDNPDIDGIVEGVVVADDDVDVDVKNSHIRNLDTNDIEESYSMESDHSGSNHNKNNNNNKNNIYNHDNDNENKNDSYDDEYEDDDDVNNNSKRNGDHDSDRSDNNNKESSSSSDVDYSYTDDHDTNTITDSKNANDNDGNKDISIDKNNNDENTKNNDEANDNDDNNPINTSNTQNNTNANTHTNTNTNTHTNTHINTKTRSHIKSHTNTNEEVSLTALSASLDSRIKRLSILIKERKDLVDDYNIHQMGKETIMNAMNRHIMKAMQHRPLLPSSDSTCSWNYWKERCEPVCVCSWQYKFGDIHPGRSCRVRVNENENGSVTEGPLLTRDTAIDPLCDSGILVPGPIRIAVTSILSFLQSVKKFIFKLERTVRFQVKEKDDLLVIASPALSQNVT